jgi:GDP/UDP-N,N'-diacetylbacillosamine 2-epimerase (hydrolysing)
MGYVFLKKKVCIICGSRSDWGYFTPILDIIKDYDFKYEVCFLNMSVLDSYGNIYEEEKRKKKYKVSYQILNSFEGGSASSMAKSIGSAILSLVDFFQSNEFDWILLAGDRGEQLAAAIAASYMYIPVAHIQSGEVSGNIDGMARHAITKLAHIHFASNSDAANRVVRMGEQKFRVHNIGAPQLDDLYKLKKNFNLNFFNKKMSANFQKEKYVICVFHGVTEDTALFGKNDVEPLMKSLELINLKKIWILPNNDAGSSMIKSKIISKKNKDDYIYSNLNRILYLSLLKNALFIIGNSSSGIIESPVFKIPCINIGRRQQGRLQATNTVNAKMELSSISKSINLVTSKNFRKKCRNVKSPYGNGNASKKILEILSSININDKLLVKRISY